MIAIQIHVEMKEHVLTMLIEYINGIVIAKLDIWGLTVAFAKLDTKEKIVELVSNYLN